MSPTLVVIVGATAVGKTAVSLSLAQALGAPIVSADSRQLYRGMEIGTAAPTAAERKVVKHYFVDCLEPTEYYSAARYEEEALRCLNTLFKTHQVVILTGGSMLYVDALCRGIDDIPTVDEEVRTSLHQRLESEGLESLRSELHRIDPDYYARVDLRNARRIVHALEVYFTSGKPYSSFLVKQRAERPFRIVKIGLQRERAELFARINARVEQMIADGLVEEAQRLLPYRDANALNTVGYKEIYRYIDGEWTLNEAIAKIQRNTRVYAKKQITWYKRDDAIRWFHPDDRTAIAQYINSEIGTEIVPVA